MVTGRVGKVSAAAAAAVPKSAASTRPRTRTLRVAVIMDISTLFISFVGDGFATSVRRIGQATACPKSRTVPHAMAVIASRIHVFGSRDPSDDAVQDGVPRRSGPDITGAPMRL